MGLSRDYYVVVGVRCSNSKPFPIKTFYWCTDNFNLSNLPDCNDDNRNFLCNLKGYLSGQHDKVLKSFETEQAPAIDTLDTDKVISENKASAELDVASVIQRGNQPKPIT